MKITKITSYLHASHLYKVARQAAYRDDGEENDPIVAIMFCVLALEAFINESGVLARMLPTSKKQNIVDGFSSVMSELEERRESILLKYHMALLVFSGSTWNEGAQPFQDFKLLITLRNALVHMKADTWETKGWNQYPKRQLSQYPKFVQALQQKGLIDAPEKSSSWLEAIAQPEVGKWACATAEKVTAEFLSVVPEGYFKESLSEHAFKHQENG